MTRPVPEASEPSADPSPDWVGYWRVRRWEEAAPDIPTYYVATTESWEVVKRAPHAEPYSAPHPILKVDGNVIVLKDEGAADEDAERWHVHVDGDTLRVTARTGPHAEAVGLAERIATDPRKADPGAEDH